MSKALDDLKAAFAGEAQANRRYLAFAKKAEEEGHPRIAHLFRAVAQAEMVHGNNHLRAMDAIKSTAENLETAIGGEHYEVVTMYPDFIKDAQEEGDRRAETSFRYAWEVEKVHEALYREALENLDKEGPDEEEYFVCPICGYTCKGKPPEKCPVCGTVGRRFERVD